MAKCPCPKTKHKKPKAPKVSKIAHCGGEARKLQKGRKNRLAGGKCQKKGPA